MASFGKRLVPAVAVLGGLLGTTAAWAQQSDTINDGICTITVSNPVYEGIEDGSTYIPLIGYHRYHFTWTAACSANIRLITGCVGYGEGYWGIRAEEPQTGIMTCYFSPSSETWNYFAERGTGIRAKISGSIP